jgi:membrane protein involved in colicin uptake
MPNYRFERAASSRRALALSLALAIHLALLAALVYGAYQHHQEIEALKKEIKAGETKTAAPANLDRPRP